MTKLPGNVFLAPLDRATAEREADQLLPILGLVEPEIATTEHLLKDDAPLHAKWDHSFVLREDKQPIGIMLGYERAADGNPLYQEPELHLGILAVAKTQQGKGYGAAMLRFFVDAARDGQYQQLTGPIEHIGLSVNDEKIGPQRLYEAFGLIAIGNKFQGSRQLHIMRATPADMSQTDRYKRTPVLRLA